MGIWRWRVGPLGWGPGGTKMRHLCRRRYNLKVSPYMRDVGVYDFADFLNRLLSVVFQYDGVCHFYHNCFKRFGCLPQKFF